MDKDIKENWNTVVLALATSGGIVHDVGSKRRIFVRLPIKSEIEPDGKIQTVEMMFDSFLVTTSQLNQIYCAVVDLQRQVDEMISDREKEKIKESTTPVKNTKRYKSTKKFPPPKKIEADAAEESPHEACDAMEFIEDPEDE